ncbi:MAG: DUF2203 domain-containing protein [Bdellovibrionaceae bacterium]|nr:DUF2203 domain-containing protein [Pseudobdellovibrionaceae bacterium]
MLPIILRITRTYSEKVKQLIERLDALSGQNEDLVLSLESQVNHLIQDWQMKIQKLGALPKGLWIADFDAGDGYFCWKYPERTIEFWHDYNDGYTKRVAVDRACRPLHLASSATHLPSHPTSD